MPSVVIIHAAEDALPARALAEKLRAAKLSPVIGKPPGEDLREAVRGASVTIALWSPRSVDQAALVEEVKYARGKNKVFHAQMQNTTSPDEFKNEKAFDLTGWRGEDDFPGWRALAKAVADKAGSGPLPPPTPRQPTSFFQPGRIDPNAVSASEREFKRSQGRQRGQAPRAGQPRPAPRANGKGGGGRSMIVGAITLLVVAGIGIGGYLLWRQSTAQTAAAAWAAVDANDAGALRAYIAGASGALREQAETRLAGLEEQSFDAAREEDSIVAFEAFLAAFPDSNHAIEARGQIAELRAQPEPALEETPPIETAPSDPDLVPPDARPDAGGPVPLSPPRAGPTN